MSDADEYRYTRFTTGLLFKDLRFRGSGPRPGDSLPEFDLATIDGTRITKKEILAERPLMLVFGSYTCPMTASSIPSLKRLHAEFGDRVSMVMLNVREAHPGEYYPQPETIEKKTAHARVLREHYDMPWTVAVDDVDGALHRAIDTKPNAAYVIDRDGTIAFRSIWARDERSLRAALSSVTSGGGPGATGKQSDDRNGDARGGQRTRGHAPCRTPGGAAASPRQPAPGDGCARCAAAEPDHPRPRPARHRGGRDARRAHRGADRRGDRRRARALSAMKAPPFPTMASETVGVRGAARGSGAGTSHPS